MKEITYREARRLAADGYTAIPLVRAIPADVITPVLAYMRLSPGETGSFLFESIEGGERLARYCLLGARPAATIAVRDARAVLTKAAGGSVDLPGDPFRALGRYMSAFRTPHVSGLPRFSGGAVGYVGYEMAKYLEPSLSLTGHESEDEARFMLFPDVVVFDRARQELLIIANILTEGRRRLGDSYDAAVDSLDRMGSALADRVVPEVATVGFDAERHPHSKKPAAHLGDAGFIEGVRDLKRHIRCGDIFQAVLSDGITAPLRAAPLSVYRALRSINPSPYMFYIEAGDKTMLGASPEMLVRVEDGVIETRPIAGTRPRGAGDAADQRMEHDLLRSVKEQAEHLMLVDLGRNDVGRVARPGTVRVPSFMNVERYSHVMHLVSSVRGRLRRGTSAWDAFAACFPAGTVTGAPKIRAMQLVAAIEKAPRGLYAGAVFYLDFRGNLDSAIAIRSMEVTRRDGERVARVQSGAGIVADSNPDRELLEIRNKARAMWEAVRMAEARA